uniref:Uncharacterized protein n=1 Tax=Magallana gigas TaxID=29159 RepID=K1PZL7_MAGGI
MQAQNNHTVWGNNLMISNLERRQYVFSLTAINAIGESKPVQARCTIRDLDEESCLLSRFFGSLFGLFLLISVGLFSFIVVAIKRKQIIIYKCKDNRLEESRPSCTYGNVDVAGPENVYDLCQ